MVRTFSFSYFHVYDDHHSNSIEHWKWSQYDGSSKDGGNRNVRRRLHKFLAPIA